MRDREYSTALNNERKKSLEVPDHYNNFTGVHRGELVPLSSLN